MEKSEFDSERSEEEEGRGAGRGRGKEVGREGKGRKEKC